MSWVLGKDSGTADAGYYWGLSPMPAEYDDITSNLLELDCCAERAIGYKRGRDLIKVVVATETAMYTTWGSYPSNKQDIAAKWFAAPYALRLGTGVTDEEDAENWEELLDKTKGVPIQGLGGRALIVEKMRRRASHELRTETMTKDELDDFWESTESIFREYIDSNSPKFRQWLTNEVGSAYENDGFEEKTDYWNQVLEDDLIAIYNGEFDE